LTDPNLEEQMARCISQRENLEAILNSVGDGILAANLDMRIVNMNDAAADILGWAQEDVIGKTCSVAFAPADGSEECALSAEHRSGNTLKDAKIEIRRPDGIPKSLLVTTHGLHDDEGALRGFVAIFRDLTELEALRSVVDGVTHFERFVGKSRVMREIYQFIEDVAESDATVLVLGESGTGKELVAEAIHKRGHRKDGPFIKVNCSALSESLLESELFGHVKGSFTGAIKDKPGRFELANGGTIFLDEIGDVSPAVQIRLLRVLQEKEFERVGGTETIRTDVRIVAATNRDLQARIKEGSFREDLYYRLYVMPIELPALRERREDLPLLIDRFVEQFRAVTSKDLRGVAAEALAVMMDHDWPGNVRELENAVEHAFVKCRSEAIEVEDLPRALVRSVLGEEMEEARDGSKSEKEVLQAVLEKVGWNRSKAAKMLGMHRTTVWRKMRELQIAPPDIP
jgi:two-component system, NtrC family, response regulator HydG